MSEYPYGIISVARISQKHLYYHCPHLLYVHLVLLIQYMWILYLGYEIAADVNTYLYILLMGRNASVPWHAVLGFCDHQLLRSTLSSIHLSETQAKCFSESQVVAEVNNSSCRGLRLELRVKWLSAMFRPKPTRKHFPDGGGSLSEYYTRKISLRQYDPFLCFYSHFHLFSKIFESLCCLLNIFLWFKWKVSFVTRRVRPCIE